MPYKSTSAGKSNIQIPLIQLHPLRNFFSEKRQNIVVKDARFAIENPVRIGCFGIPGRHQDHPKIFLPRILNSLTHIGD